MKITIEPTDVLTELYGRQVRLWRGVTDQGTPIEVFMAAVAAREDRDCSQLERELMAIPPPPEALTPLAHITPARHIF